jgi:hypothetical protein
MPDILGNKLLITSKLLRINCRYCVSGGFCDFVILVCCVFVCVVIQNSAQISHMASAQMNKQAKTDKLLLNPITLLTTIIELLAVGAIEPSCWKNQHFCFPLLGNFSSVPRLIY